jgi:hypothetical protein
MHGVTTDEELHAKAQSRQEVLTNSWLHRKRELRVKTQSRQAMALISKPGAKPWGEK